METTLENIAKSLNANWNMTLCNLVLVSAYLIFLNIWILIIHIKIKKLTSEKPEQNITTNAKKGCVA